MNNWNLLFKETGGTAINVVGEARPIGEPTIGYKDPLEKNQKDAIRFFLERGTKDPNIETIEEITGTVGEVIINSRKIEEIFRDIDNYKVSAVRINFNRKNVIIIGATKK